MCWYCRRFRTQAQQRNDFVVRQKAVLSDYMKKQQALLSQKREVKRLSDLIMLELRVSEIKQLSGLFMLAELPVKPASHYTIF